MSLESIIRQNSDLPKRQVRLLTSGADVRTFTQGILLVLHIWSGDAIFVLRRLSQVLHKFPNTTLGVIDGDLIDRETLKHLGREEPLHGHGDSFWISNGQVIASLSREFDGWEDLAFGNTRLVSGSP